MAGGISSRGWALISVCAIFYDPFLDWTAIAYELDSYRLGGVPNIRRSRPATRQELRLARCQNSQLFCRLKAGHKWSGLEWSTERERQRSCEWVRKWIRKRTRKRTRERTRKWTRERTCKWTRERTREWGGEDEWQYGE